MTPAITLGSLNLSPLLPLVVLLPILAILLGLVAGQLIRHRGTRLGLDWLARLGIFLLLLVIAFRPTVGGSAPASTAEGGLEVYFVVDTTSSMAAEDYNDATRLNGVKTDIAALARNLPGAEFALITFDSAAVQRMPLTTDLGALRSAVTVLTQEVTGYSAGSSIDAPVELLERVLTEAKELKPDRPRAVFYFGDGEQTSATEPGSFESLSGLVDGGAVLGYGTESGGPMLTFDGYDDEQSSPTYIIDYTLTPPAIALSRINEVALQDAASQIGVPYQHRESGAPVDALVDSLQVSTPTTDSRPAGAPFEFYWILAIPLALLLLREAISSTSALRELRQPRKAKR